MGDKTDPGVECQTCNKFYDTDALEDNNYYLDGAPFIKKRAKPARIEFK